MRSGIGATYNLLSVFDAGEQPEPSRTTASTSTRTSFSRDKGRSGGKPSENILALLTCICSVERARLAALFMPQVETVESCAESRKTFLNRPLFPCPAGKGDSLNCAILSEQFRLSFLLLR